MFFRFSTPFLYLGMLFILYTTGRCNLSCRYCGGSFSPSLVPWSIQYDKQLLKQLIGEGDVVAFYGGEPLLNLDFIKWAVDSLNAERFVIQTNGLLLKLLDGETLRKLDTILVSIDGVEEVTDRWRGRGVYAKVIENVRGILSRGFRGDLVARMTVTEQSDIYRDVRHLLSLKLFNHVHWQLNLVWTDRGNWRDLWGWIRGSYARGLRRLIEEWVESMYEGRVEGIAPFQGIVKRLLGEDRVNPPCGSGANSFTILTNGRIIACPIAVSEKWAEVGRLGDTVREDLENYTPPIGEPCTSCSYFNICGGRCLYTHVERLWGEEGVKAVCEASKLIIDLLREKLPEIQKLLREEVIKRRDLFYPSYNNTVEIMP